MVIRLWSGERPDPLNELESKARPADRV